MPTSPYFNSQAYTNATQEKLLLEDLMVELIKIYGVDVYLIPRESMDEVDMVYGEDPLKKFDKSYGVEMLMLEPTKWQGTNDFFSKFGLELRDDTTFIVTRRSFMRHVPSDFNRDGGGPREGDLIWSPLTNALLEIKHVEEEAQFFALGKKTPYYYELLCERFRYSEEVFSTGDSDLDDEMLQFAYTLTLPVVSTGNVLARYYTGEQVFQGNTLDTATATATVVDFNYPGLMLNVAHTKGTFVSNVAIKGANSNAWFTFISTDTIQDIRRDDIVDNKRLEEEGNTIIDFSEDNPFGKP